LTAAHMPLHNPLAACVFYSIALAAERIASMTHLFSINPTAGAPKPTSIETGIAKPQLSADTRYWRRWLLIFAVVGVALRLIRLGANIPLNGDETLLGMNLLHRGFIELTKPMDYAQIAPVGFLWAQRSMLLLFGKSDLALRLLPTLAGVAGLLLFAEWMMQILTPLAGAAAVGILAVANYPVFHAVENKPYSGDLLMSTLMLMLAARYLHRPQIRWLVSLLIVTPMAILVSYPATFVAGGIVATLGLFTLSRRRAHVLLIVLLGIVLAASFWLFIWHIAAAQYSHAKGTQDPYWQDAFPPRSPLAFAWWFVRVHTGNLFAYPFGGNNFGSTGTTLFVIVGIVALLRARRGWLLALLLSPFAVTMAAAALHRYPYGQSVRICQHLAPVVILLSGVGVAAAIERAAHYRTVLAKQLSITGLLVLTVICVVDIRGDFLPSHDVVEHYRARDIAHKILQQLPPGESLAILRAPEKTPTNVAWYLCDQENRLLWNQTRPDTRWALTESLLPDGTTPLRPSSTVTATAGKLAAESLHQPVAVRAQWAVNPMGPPQQWDLFTISPSTVSVATRPQ